MADIVFYQERDGVSALVRWIDSLDDQQHEQVRDRIARLRDIGSKLRRPHADFLRDGIYELRARAGNVQLRVLYAFVGKEIVLLTNGFQKSGSKVPPIEIKRAIGMLEKYRSNPEAHTYRE